MISWVEALFFVFLGSWILLFLRLITKSIALLLQKNMTSNELPPITVVIAARNEEKHLKKLIPALMSQDYPAFEVRLALDRCSDGSLQIMKDFEAIYSNLTTLIIDHLPDQFSPKKYALTLGIKGASYDWIVLTDADCLPASDRWLRSFGCQMDNNCDYVLGSSPYRQTPSFLNRYIRYETFLTAYDYLSAACLRNPYMGVGRNLAYRKSLFLKVKGFNQFQGLMGGDDDLFVQYHAIPNRVKINIGEDAIIWSDAKDTLSSYWKQKKRHFSVSKFYKTKSKLIHSVNSVAQILLWTTFIILATQNHQMLLISSLFLGLFLMKGVLYWQMGKKIGMGFDYWYLPILETIHSVFVPIAAAIAIFSKKVTWK